MTADQHAESFVRALEGLAGPAAAPGASSEAVVDHRIRANVLEILRKMFVLYHDAAWHGRGRVELLGLDGSLPPAARVAAAWERFVATLRAEWEERLAADERFGREIEARKGRVQLQAVSDALAAWEAHRPDGGDRHGGD